MKKMAAFLSALGEMGMEDGLMGGMSFEDMEAMGMVEKKCKPIDLILAEGKIIGQKARIDHLQDVARAFSKEDIANSEAMEGVRGENQRLNDLLGEVRHEKFRLERRLDNQEERQAQLTEENAKLNAIVARVSATLSDLSANKKVTKKTIFEAIRQALANNQRRPDEI